MRKGLIFILLLCMVFSLSGVVANEIDGNGKVSADLNKFNHDISSSADNSVSSSYSIDGSVKSSSNSSQNRDYYSKSLVRV